MVNSQTGRGVRRHRRYVRAAAALLTLALGLAVAAQCANAQYAFTDDAARTVQLPREVLRVFAAGAPAEILLYTLVPEKLVGRNHPWTPEALELVPSEYRSPVQIVNLPERDDARYDTELLALRPDVYVDYGTVDPDYVGALEAIQARTRVPGIILDGSLTQIPDVYRRAGAALGVADRGERLGAEAQRIIEKYRDALTGTPVRVYLACTQNGASPCVQGHSSGEAAELLGAINAAGTTQSAPRRPLTVEEIRASAPDVIIAASPKSAAALRGDPAWQALPAVAAGRVHSFPELPFGWGPRPPSVNRLLGVIWLAYVLPGRPFDAAFFADVRAFFNMFYHVDLTQAQLEQLVAAE